MNRYWHIGGYIYLFDYPVLKIEWCDELQDIQESTKERMKFTKNYICQVHSGIIDGLDYIMSYFVVIRAKDQTEMLDIFKRNTTQMHVVWDADMLYNHKEPFEAIED